MKRRILDFMMTVCCMVFSFLALVACDNELDIRQEYPFTVESMPVADEIVNGETVEIRLEIKPEGNFSGTVYTLRYFQPDGKGSLKMEDNKDEVSFHGTHLTFSSLTVSARTRSSFSTSND